jgi:MFS family permease
MGWVCLDMILETCSMDRLSGRIRGIHLTVINAGILAGPFLSMHILNRYNFQGIFIAMLVIYSIMFSIALIKIKDFNREKVNRLTVREILFKFLKRKNVMRAYYISFMLEFFYALMVIYTPMYLRDLGISWNDIGIIFTVMLIPFVILEYPIGLLADKKYGEKELLIFSIFIMGATTLGLYFVHSAEIIVWSLVLFFTRIGASMVEILRDSYFYKRIDSYDIDLIDFFRTSRAVAFIAAAIISTIYLFIFPVKAIFILVAIVAFSALYPALKLADNKSEREMKRAD